MNALYDHSQHGGLPPFDRLDAAQVRPAIGRILEELTVGQRSIEADVQPTWASAVEAVGDLVEPLERAWGAVTHLVGVKNSPELREAHQAIQPAVVEASLKLAQSEPLFRALSTLRTGPGFASLPPERKRILDKKILEARLAGIDLPPEQRARFTAIQQELSELATTFANHVLDSTKAYGLMLTTADEVDGVPHTALAMAAAAAQAAGHAGATAEQGPWRITLDMPSFDAFMRHAKRRDLRERVYRAYLARASELDLANTAAASLDNGPLIARILGLRREKARLLGFPSYAELSLATKMAPSVDEVERLLEELRTTSLPVAERELAELSSLAGFPVQHWDVGFWAERLREQRYAFSEEELRPYFPLPRVLEGLFALVKRLFGVHVVDATGTAPRWHDDVRYFEVKDERGADVAGFYLDPYARPAEKRGGAWMDDCITRRRTATGVRLPVAYLCCNQTPPVGDTPSLMTFREVETLFHEFGHGLQHMLTRVDHVDASGIRGIEWDAVELPSQFMENWCTHKPTLIGMSRHVQSGAALPLELFDKVRAAKTFRAASMMLRQISFARLDLELHARFDPGGQETVFDVQRRLAPATSVLPVLHDDRFLCSFSHIFAGGYAAGYYSYKWAEVLSADAFGAFEEAGLDEDDKLHALGRRFRDTVLALGGGAHPSDVFRAFRGRDPRTEALLRHAGLGPPAKS
ncbi:MAG: peptidase M3 [Deltaproteobacteria bacterium RBG_16_71_12]|nr:MAG: peptidase M3 [Deltaproteobacteria bacterium RBG_16_71_12]